MYCGKLEQAARSLQWLRGDAVDVEAELANIQTNIETSRRQKVSQDEMQWKFSGCCRGL